MYNFAINIIPDTAGGFYVNCDDIPFFNSAGDTIEEALIESLDALILSLSIYVDKKMPIPIPSSPKKGQYVIYLPTLATAKAILWNTLLDQKITQTHIANQLGISKQATGKLFDFLHNSKIEQIEKALSILGKRLSVTEENL